MAAAPIDLSAGMVPKPIDLSAGLVPKADAPAEKSLWQKAKDNFNANTQGAQPGDSAVKGFIENIGQGGGQIIRAAAHPLDTLGAMGNTIAHPLDQAHTEVDALRANPSRFIGNAIGQAGTGAILGEAAGAGINAVAPKILPAAGRAVLLGKTPEAAYESALKPSVTLDAAERASAVKGGLENEIPVSKTGADKIADRIDELNQAVKDQIASDPTRPIDPNAVATRADEAKAKFGKQVNAGGDLAAIDASKQQFLSEQGATPGKPAPPMNAIDAQEMKQGTYSVLKGKFGEQGSASVEAQKALARGLKEEIAAQFPEISNLNAEESRLLDLQPLIERAVNRASNQGLFRLGTGAVAATIRALGGGNKLAAVAAVMKQVLDDPMIKSRLAIAVSKGAKVPYSQASGRVAAYSSALGSTAFASQENSTGDNPDQSTSAQP